MERGFVAPRVVVRDEHEDAGLAGVLAGDDVLRGAPAREAAPEVHHARDVERRRQRGGADEREARDGLRDGEDAADHRGRAVEAVGEAVAGADLGRLDLRVAPEGAQPALEMARGAALRVATRDPSFVGRQAVYLA